MDWMRKKANKKANKMRNAMNRGQVFHGTGNVLGSTTTDGTQDRSKVQYTVGYRENGFYNCIDVAGSGEANGK